MRRIFSTQGERQMSSYPWGPLSLADTAVDNYKNKTSHTHVRVPTSMIASIGIKNLGPS